MRHRHDETHAPTAEPEWHDAWWREQVERLATLPTSSETGIPRGSDPRRAIM